MKFYSYLISYLKNEIISLAHTIYNISVKQINDFSVKDKVTEFSREYLYELGIGKIL